MDLAPRKAMVLRGGKEVEVSTAEKRRTPRRLRGP
jgi:hypothetical protein